MSEIVRNHESFMPNNAGVQSLSALQNQFDPARAQHLQQETLTPKNQEPIENLKEFYDAIENPINDDETLLSIIETFAKTDKTGLRQADSDPFYDNLQEIGTEQKEKGIRNPEAKQRFEEKMYEKWEPSILSMGEEEFKELKSKKLLNDKLWRIHNFVKEHPECKTESDLREAIYEIPDGDAREDMDKALDESSWKHTDQEWTHVKSRYVNSRREKGIKADHRFYLNIDSRSTHKVADTLVDYYEKYQIPYYFKFSDKGARADTLVVYASTKDLLKNANILLELKNEHPELAEHFHQPPILSGVIDGDIGYGAEYEKGSSFSKLRSEMMEKVLKSATVDWVAAHQNDVINYNGNKVLFSDFVIEKEIQRLKQKFSEKFTNDVNGYETINKLSHSDAMLRVTKECGYNQTDLEDGSRMFSYISKTLRDNFATMMETFQNTGTCNLEINGRFNCRMQIGGDEFMHVLKGISPKIAKNDKTFLTDIRKKIREKCIEDGIDPDKFVFYDTTVQKMQEQYRLDSM